MLEHEISRLPADKLTVDPALQRGLNERRVAKIAAQFDAAALGLLTVSHRIDGTYHVIDGRHRLAAARIAEGESVSLLCKVFVGLGTDEEAKMFRLMNTTAKPPAIDSFRIRVIEGDPAAVDIDRMIREAGWCVQLLRGAHQFAAVAAAERVYKLDPAAVERSLVTITKAWGHDEVHGQVFEGLGLMYARYREAVDLSGMVERLSVFPGGQRALLGGARGMSSAVRMKVAAAVADIAVREYNARRRGRALPAWRS